MKKWNGSSSATSAERKIKREGAKSPGVGTRPTLIKHESVAIAVNGKKESRNAFKRKRIGRTNTRKFNWWKCQTTRLKRTQCLKEMRVEIKK